MRIKRKFLQLTKYTYPYGTEAYLENMLPEGYKQDKYGNYYLSVGDNYSTMFACHLDTANKEFGPVRHTFHDKPCDLSAGYVLKANGRYIMSDGTTILGADDKAGVVVALFMIEKKVPGLYYFFIGEEVGCVGSSDLASDMEKEIYHIDELKNIKKVVSFDRRGTTSVITDQFYGNCCSDEFALSLCKELNKSGLNMRPDDTGVLTDSAQFMTFIPECTNISVGYYNEHTHKEAQDIEYLYQLCNAVVKVDWESLPVERDPATAWSPFHGGGWDCWDWDDLEDEPVREKGDLGLHFSDENYSFVIRDSIRTKAYISKEWIETEKRLITEALNKQGRVIEKITWDGTSCWCLEKGETINEYVGNRSDLMAFVNNFDVIPVAHLRYTLDSIPTCLAGM